MSGIFEHLEMFDEGKKVSARQALAVANKRFNDQFADFLRSASSDKEFNSRLALVEGDITNMINDVAYEYDGNADNLKTALLNTVKDIRIATKPPHLEVQDEEQYAAQHSEVPPWLKKQDDDEDQEDGGNRKDSATDKCEKCECDPCECNEHESKTADIHSQPVANPVPLAETPGYTAGGQDIETTLENAPSAVGTGHEAAAHTVEKKGDEFFVIEDGDEKAAGPFDSKEKAQARAKELNELENLETEETHKEAKGKCECWNGYERVPGTKPCAPGSCRKCDDHRKKESATTPAMAKALALKEAAARGEKRNFFAKDEWVNEGDTVTEDGKEKKVEDIAQHGDHKVVELNDGSVEDIDDVHVAASTETGDKTEERENLPTGNEDAHDGPSPKIDKTKWKPNATNPEGNLEPIKTEGENSPHPTRHMDIKDKPDYQEDTFDTVKKYDNKVWEREQLPTAKGDEAGFEGTRNIDQPTKAAETFPNKNQTDPVTNVSLPEALAEKKIAGYLEKVAVFEDERDIIEHHIDDDYTPFPGFWQEMANLKRKGISDDVIRDLLYGSWRADQDPEFLESIGITPLRDPSEWKSDEELEREDRARKMLQEESEAPLAPRSSPEDALAEALAQQPSEEPAEALAEEPTEDISEEPIAEETPEEIEEIIEEGDKPNDRVKVVHEEDEDTFDEEPSNDDLESIMREIEENPDDWQ
jgi:hypothetical protein